MSQEGHRGGCPQGPAVLGATLQPSARKGLRGPTGDMHKEGHPSPGGTAPTNSSLQQERHQGHICHCKTTCPHGRVTPMSLMLPWAGLWVPGPGAGSTLGHRAGTPGAHLVGTGQVRCRPLEGNEGVSVWERKAWGCSSDGCREGKGQDRDTAAVASPGTTPGTWHWGTW